MKLWPIWCCYYNLHKGSSESSIKTCASSIWGNFPLDSAWFRRWSAKISLEIPTDFQRKASRKPVESLIQSVASFRCSFYGPEWFFCHILSLFDYIYISNSLMMQLSVVFCVELYIQPEEQRRRVSECLKLCLFTLFLCRLKKTKTLLDKARYGKVFLVTLCYILNFSHCHCILLSCVVR